MRQGIKLFEFGVRTLALGVINQYLTHIGEFSDPDLNRFLSKELPQASLGTWNEMFFATLAAHHERRDTFFIEELYDLYWDTSRTPHAKRKKVRPPFDGLIPIRNDLVHRIEPNSELGWRKLAEEILPRLREILGQFEFLQRYDLVRILERTEQGYRCQLYKGDHLTDASYLLPPDPELQVDRFYLVRDKTHWLALYPLLVFYDDPNIPNEPPEASFDAALYDTASKTRVVYIATVLNQIVNDLPPALVTAVVGLIEAITPQRAHIFRPEPQALTWSLLQVAARDIEERRFGEVRAKHRAELYFQRAQVKQEFVDFLRSDKRIFLLLGKSGIGKSNFIVSLADEYAAGSQVCFLLYNGAKLESDKPLAEIIVRDIEQALRWTRNRDHVDIKDLLEHLQRIQDIRAHHIVVVIDAINENFNAIALLRQINQFVDSFSVPWLRVVISARPEAWRVLKAQVNLSEHRFYRDTRPLAPGTDSEALGVELTLFSLGELSQVYENYRQAYDLQTSFKELPKDIQEVLIDPLALKLVAETFRGRALVGAFKPDEIYGSYLEQLIRDGRLAERDIDFLERYLMPLMLQGNGNKIANDEIYTAKPSVARSFFEFTTDDSTIWNHQVVNQSFRNLADAEILIKVGSPLDYSIKFKYERFYDYFAGKYYFKTVQSSPTPATEYEHLASQIREKSYLWGAVYFALDKEWKDSPNSRLLQDLACSDDQIMLALLATLLTARSDQQRDAVLAFLDAIEQRATNRAKSMLPFLPGPLVLSEEAARNAKRLAVDVAATVGAHQILENALLDDDKSIRDFATLRTYSYWELDHGGGYAVIRALSEQTANRLGLVNIGNLETLAELTALIAARHLYAETDSVLPLLPIWRSVLDKFPLLRTSGPLGFAGGLVRSTMYRVADGVIKLMLAATISTEQSQQFLRLFPLPPGDKEIVFELLHYFDPEYGSLETVKTKLLASRRRSVVYFMLSQPVLVSHCLTDMDTTLPIIKWLVAQSDDDWGAGAAAGAFEISLLFRPQILPEWINLDQGFALEKIIKALDDHEFRVYDIAANILTPLVLECRTGLARSDLIPLVVNLMNARNLDQQTIVQQDLLTALRMIALKGYPDFALNTLQELQENQQQLDLSNADVAKSLVEMLARIGMFYPSKLQRYLALDVLSEDLRVQVRRLKATGSTSELLGLDIWELAHSLSIVPTLRPLWIQFLQEVLAASSLGSAVRLAVERMLILTRNPAPPAPSPSPKA